MPTNPKIVAAGQPGVGHLPDRVVQLADGTQLAAVVLVDANGNLAGDAGYTGASGNVTIGGSLIALPVDVQSLYRTQVVLTSAVLAANATYTSASVDALNFRRITGKMSSDVGGSYAVQQSDDATTWDSVTGAIAVAAGAVAVYDVVIYARYARLIYTNGAAAQTAFRLSGYLAAA